VRVYLTQLEKARFTVDGHVALLEALLTRDPERAEAAMRDHVLSTVPELVHALRRADKAR
jgi:DNA-binding GntR family transcriptional regulator